MTTHQPSLFGQDAYGGGVPIPVPLPPRAANGDPWTSHEAAARHAKIGKMKIHRAIALALVKAMPSCTGHELWARASASDRAALGNYHELYRRLSDVRNAGLVTQGAARPCAIKNSMMMVWDPVGGSNQ